MVADPNIDVLSTRATEFALVGRGFVVEDSMIIAMDAASILEDLGASHVKIASAVPAALAWLETNKPDFALLDVNLGDQKSVAVAEKLFADGVPFVLVTGHDASAELEMAYPPCVIVQKPFSAASIEAAFAKSFDVGIS